MERREHFRVAAAMLVSCAVCAFAWHWVRTETTTGSETLYPLLGHLAVVLNFPGWLVVTVFDPWESPAQLATKLTDTLVPILSGLFWVLLVVLFVTLSNVFGKYVRWPDNSL